MKKVVLLVLAVLVLTGCFGGNNETEVIDSVVDKLEKNNYKCEEYVCTYIFVDKFFDIRKTFDFNDQIFIETKVFTTSISGDTTSIIKYDYKNNKINYSYVTGNLDEYEINISINDIDNNDYVCSIEDEELCLSHLSIAREIVVIFKNILSDNNIELEDIK